MGVACHLIFYNVNRKKVAKMFDLLETSMWYETKTGIEEINMTVYYRAVNIVTKFWIGILLFCWQGTTSWPIMDPSSER